MRDEHNFETETKLWTRPVGFEITGTFSVLDQWDTPDEPPVRVAISVPVMDQDFEVMAHLSLEDAKAAVEAMNAIIKEYEEFSYE